MACRTVTSVGRHAIMQVIGGVLPPLVEAHRKNKIGVVDYGVRQQKRNGDDRSKSVDITDKYEQ